MTNRAIAKMWYVLAWWFQGVKSLMQQGRGCCSIPFQTSAVLCGFQPHLPVPVLIWPWFSWWSLQELGLETYLTHSRTSGQPGLWEASVPRAGIGTRWALGPVPTQVMLWFCEDLGDTNVVRIRNTLLWELYEHRWELLKKQQQLICTLYLVTHTCTSTQRDKAVHPQV